MALKSIEAMDTNCQLIFIRTLLVEFVFLCGRRLDEGVLGGRAKASSIGKTSTIIKRFVNMSK